MYAWVQNLTNLVYIKTWNGFIYLSFHFPPIMAQTLIIKHQNNQDSNISIEAHEIKLYERPKLALLFLPKGITFNTLTIGNHTHYFLAGFLTDYSESSSFYPLACIHITNHVTTIVSTLGKLYFKKYKARNEKYRENLQLVVG